MILFFCGCFFKTNIGGGSARAILFFVDSSLFAFLAKARRRPRVFFFHGVFFQLGSVRRFWLLMLARRVRAMRSQNSMLPAYALLLLRFGGPMSPGLPVTTGVVVVPLLYSLFFISFLVPPPPSIFVR